MDAGFCEMTGLPFNQGDEKRAWNSPTIDRIKPELGYVIGNVRVICWCLNAALGDWGEDETRKVMTAWLTQK